MNTYTPSKDLVQYTCKCGQPYTIKAINIPLRCLDCAKKFKSTKETVETVEIRWATILKKVDPIFHTDMIT